MASGGRFDRSSLNVFDVNIGMWDGVFRLKLGSWTSAIAHIVSFRNMEADATLSKYAVVLFGSGGYSSGSAQPGSLLLSINALNALNLLFDLPADAPC